MGIRGLLGSMVIFLCQFDLAIGQANSAALPAPNIRAVKSDTLNDLAVAFADPFDPVIYYNPRLMARLGAELSAFALAHEYSHIQLGHRRPSWPDAGSREDLERLLQGWELAADCSAAARLARERPSALRAAIAFFERMGPDSVDREHPSGTVRAAQLASCGRTMNGDPSLLDQGPRTGATTIQFR
jgi:hypothetical protein